MAAPRMAELEETLGAPVGEVAVDRLPEWEATPHGAGPDLPAQVLPDMEGTRMAPVSSGPVLPMDEMDSGRAEPVGPAVAAPSGPVTCRYCRHVQPGGVLCEACGMSLPRAPRAKAAAGAFDEDGWGLCQKCGTRAQNGRRCGECGAQVRLGA